MSYNKTEQSIAEGAEEIFRECFAEEAAKRGDTPLSDEKWNDLVKESGGFMFRAMEKFATFHAQRIAEKMVEEKLKKEYERGIEDGKIIGKHGSVSYIE